MNRDRDSALERLLTGDLDPDSDEARELFVADPDASSDLQRARGIEAAVRLAGEERRSVVDEALGLEGAPGEDKVRQWVQAHLGTAPPAAARTAPARPWPWLVAAAAAAVFLIWMRPFAAEDAQPAPLDPGPAMGASALRLLSPVGDVELLDEFRWEYELERGQYFQLVVYAGDGAAELAVVDDLEEPSWRPDPQEIETWPSDLVWEVRVRSGGRDLLSPASASVRRSP